MKAMCRNCGCTIAANATVPKQSHQSRLMLDAFSLTVTSLPVPMGLFMQDD